MHTDHEASVNELRQAKGLLPLVLASTGWIYIGEFISCLVWNGCWYNGQYQYVLRYALLIAFARGYIK